MIIIGVTGLVASGKDFVSDCFKKLGAKIFDADQEAHQILLQDQEAKNKILRFFPNAVKNGVIDRKELGKLVFNNQEKLQLLESIIHPILKRKRQKFIAKSYRQNTKIIVLNIPLLFEKNIHKECNKTILVVSPKHIQKQRFIDRSKENINFNETELVKKFYNILKNQQPNFKKKKFADFIINNGQNKFNTFCQVQKIFNQIIR